MQTIKCVLVNLRGGTRNAGSLGCANVFEPLGLLYLSAYIKNIDGVQCNVIHQIDQSHDEIIQQIRNERPDIVGFSTLTVTINSVLSITKILKNHLPNLVTILGGDHVTAEPGVVQHDYVDFAIRGEGELPLAMLVKRLRDEEMTEDIPGLSFYGNNGLVNNPRSKNTINIDQLPLPDRKAQYLKHTRVGGLMNPFMSKQHSVAMVSATRGCPFKCSFCNNKLMWQQNHRSREPKMVVDELELLVRKFGTNTIFFSDLTFNASKRYTLELCNALITRDLPVHWYAMCNIHLMDEELSETMARANCSKIGFGIESFIPATMDGGKGKISLKFEKTNELLKMINANGIFTKGYFIIGFPWETKKMLDLLREKLSHLETHEVRIAYYVPFVGTEGYSMHKHLIDDWDLDYWSCLDRPILTIQHMTKTDIRDQRQKLYDSFYKSPSWRPRIIKIAEEHWHLASPVRDFLNGIEPQLPQLRSDCAYQLQTQTAVNQ